jgi:hypothetical protein
MVSGQSPPGRQRAGFGVGRAIPATDRQRVHTEYLVLLLDKHLPVFAFTHIGIRLDGAEAYLRHPITLPKAGHQNS